MDKLLGELVGGGGGGVFGISKGEIGGGGVFELSKGEIGDMTAEGSGGGGGGKSSSTPKITGSS